MMKNITRLVALSTCFSVTTSFVAKSNHRYPSHQTNVAMNHQLCIGSFGWGAKGNSMGNRHLPLRSAVMVNTTEYARYSSYAFQEDIVLELKLQREQFELLLRQTRSDLMFVEPQEEYMEVMAESALVAAKADTAKDTATKSGLFGDVWNARLLLLGAAALYGTNFSIVKLLGDSMPVGISSTLRFGMAAIATLPWLLSQGDASTMDATLAGLEVGMWTSIGYVAQAVGLETTDASKSAFICSLAVVIVPILDFMAGKCLLPREVVGAVMAVAGVGFLEGFFSGGADLTLSGGDIASLVQPLAFGMGFWRMEHAMRQYPESADRLTAAQLMAVFVASAGYCAVTPMLGTPWPEATQMASCLTDPVMLGALFWTGVVTTALTVYMETLALKTLSAAETTLIFSTEPLWGAGCAALVMGEHFGPEAALGAGLILASCVVSNVGTGLFGTRSNAESA